MQGRVSNEVLRTFRSLLEAEVLHEGLSTCLKDFERMGKLTGNAPSKLAEPCDLDEEGRTQRRQVETRFLTIICQSAEYGLCWLFEVANLDLPDMDVFGFQLHVCIVC